MQQDVHFQEPHGVFNLPLPSFDCLLSSDCKLVSPKDHTMVVGYLEATALSIQLFVLCLQSVCFVVSLSGTDHESQAIR